MFFLNLRVRWLTWRHTGGAEVYFYSFFNLGARWGWVVKAMSGPLCPWESPGTHARYRLGVVQGRSWRAQKISPPTGGRIAIFYTYYAIPGDRVLLKIRDGNNFLLMDQINFVVKNLYISRLLNNKPTQYALSDYINKLTENYSEHYVLKSRWYSQRLVRKWS